MIRFYNGKILSFSPDACLSDGEVWTDGPLISHAGPVTGDLPSFEREINLNGGIVMPGFKNAHSHTAMTFLRSLADDKPLDRWLNEIVFPCEGKLREEGFYYLVKLGIMEYLSCGITSCFDMYYFRDVFVEACESAGFRAVICSGMNNFDSDPAIVERDFLRFNGGSALTGYVLGMHAEYTTSRERIEYVASLAKKYKAPCFTHLCETKKEAQGCIERYGMTAPVFLNELGFFDYGGGGFHCVYMSDEDIELFASKGLYAVTCPASNLKLASGIAPLEKLRKAGIPIAIGTDGAASNNALDMFREMYLATALQKVSCQDASALPAAEVLKMACVNGARAMGLNSCDDLAAGKAADLTVLSLDRPNMRPVNNLISNMVYSGNPSNIRLTMVNGKILYENGEFFIGDDAEKIYSETQKFADSLREC